MSWDGSADDGDERPDPEWDLPSDPDWDLPPDPEWDLPAEAEWDAPVRQPLTWRGLTPEEVWGWFDQLWSDVCMLRERYRLAVRSQWWSDERQLEVLAALAAWVDRYDSGEWDDPPGKLALLFDLERVAAALREGLDPFAPERDRAAFTQYVRDLGAVPPASPAPGEDRN